MKSLLMKVKKSEKDGFKLNIKKKTKIIILPSKVHLLKETDFPVVMYGCESWTVKKAEHQRIDAFQLRCWKRLLSIKCRRQDPEGCKGFQEFPLGQSPPCSSDLHTPRRHTDPCQCCKSVFVSGPFRN